MKKILATLALCILMANSASAVITTDEAKSPEYMLIRGYSPETARMINIQDTAINGKPATYEGVKPYRYKTNIKPIDYVVNYFLDGYVGSDDGKFGRRTISPSPSASDL